MGATLTERPMRRPVPFGKYLLLDRISVGGMAEVFKAKSFGVQGFEKVIAIKRILPSMGKDEDFIKMFIDEAKIAGQLAHANIGQIHELGQIEGAHFIAMEYIWGRDLLQLQNRFKKLDKRLSTTSSAFIVMKICEGLHYAHKKRDVLGSAMEIVHRDCSPQNVVVSYEGEVKLIDFGIARAASRSARTQAGVLKGKFAYMSPEQVRGLPLDRRSDIFSLGIILYECLTGRRLFNGESDFAILEKVRNAEVDLQALKDAEIPAELEKIVLKSLNRTPDDRYQWCADMRDDLRNFLQTTAEVYTYRSLGEEMRAAFGTELAREQELMDVYANIGKGGISQELFEAAQVLVGGEESSVEGFESSNVARVRKAGLAIGSQPRPATGSEDFEDHPTEIFGELGINDLIGVSDDVGEERPLVSELGEVKVLVAEQTGRIQTGSGAADDAPLLSFVEKAAAGVTPAGMAPIGHYARPVGASLPAPGRRAPLPRPRRATRDVLIGVSLALAMVSAFVAVKQIFFQSEAVSQAPRATLVVLVGDKKAAEVYLGDQRVGTVPMGEALTVDALEPGSYAIRVAREGAVACEATITVDAERVKVFNCDFADGLPARLLLEDLRPADIVVVDGKMVPASSLEGGLALAAGRAHSIAVTRDGDLIDEFDLTLSGQEQFRHKVRPARSDAGLDDEEEVFEMSPNPVESGAASARSGSETSSGNATPVRGTGALLGLETSESPEQKSKPRVVAGALQEPELADSNDSKPRNVVAKAPAATHGYLTAWTRPWARVYVDGKDTGKVTPIAPAARIKLRPGNHKVSFKVGSKMHDFSVTIEAGEETKLAKILD